MVSARSLWPKKWQGHEQERVCIPTIIGLVVVEPPRGFPHRLRVRVYEFS
jgi:hypothetical protein